MIHTVSAYYRLRQRDFVNKYPASNDIPVEQRSYLVRLEQGYRLWLGKAEALGWREPDQEAEASYQQSVNRAQSAQ